MASDEKSLEKSKFASFLDSQQPIEIFDKICSYLNMGDFMNFRQVCKRYYQVENLQRCFNLDKLLYPFVPEPRIFQSELGKHDALISGVFALNFFQFGRSNVPILDVFVKAGGQTDGLVDYIKNYANYDKEDSLKITIGVARFLFTSSKRPGKAIRLTATHGPPVETILRCSYATTSVNFITWNKAYSIFPLQTLIYHKLYYLRFLDDEFGSFLREQVSQGWTNRDIIWPDLSTDPRHKISNGHRRVGDQSSLIIPLDTTNVQKASTPDSAIQFAQFEIYTEPDSFPTFGQVIRPLTYNSPRIRVQELTSPALRHGYTFASPLWQQFLVKRLQRWIRLELLKLKTGERPEQFQNNTPTHSDISLPLNFQPPATWDYADDQIPAWYTKWEQSHVVGSRFY